MSHFSNTKIFNNTILLYFRMGLVMLITLFSSRIILNQLGFIDYGIFTLISGFIVIFTFFGSSLSNAAQRFLSIQYGLGDPSEVKKVFSLARLNFLLLSIVVVIILESLGYWLLNTKLDIPSNRLLSANIIFQILIVSVFFTVNSYAYYALLLARENMNVFAMLGILESIFRLIIAYSIIYYGGDKLVLYSFLFTLITILITLVQIYYCHKSYLECTFKFIWDKKLFKEMYTFIGWNSLIAFVESVNQQGVGVLLNLFFGPIINAARGISFQISNALGSFSLNIYMAARPQLIKAYATKEFDKMASIIGASSKISFYLLLILAIPIILNLDYILHLWLTDIPDHTYHFSIVIIIYCLVDSIKNPFWASAQATGNLRKYALFGSLIFSLNFPISWILLHLNYPPVTVYYSYVLVRIVYLFFIMRITSDLIPEIKLNQFARKTLIPILKVTLIAPIIPYLIKFYLSGFSELWILLITTFISSISIMFAIYLFGLDQFEKDKIVSILKIKLF